jgi:hypothetical protein
MGFSMIIAGHIHAGALLNWGDIMAETLKTRLTDRNRTKRYF